MSTPGSGRPIVLTFVRYYLPGYKSGGPIRTIANMVEALGNEFDFRVVTSDRDATDTGPYQHLTGRDGWLPVGKAKVLYLSPSQKSLRNIGRIVRETPHDVLYLNSFFDPDFTQKPLLARRLRLAPKTRCVIAPRGEFSQGALAIKARKKKSFLAAARMAGLYRGLEWQASSEHEAADIRRAFGSVAGRIKIAKNLPDRTPRTPPPFVARAPGEPLRIVFLSRISPMKNLDYALEVLKRVRTPVRFDIYGPVRDEDYWSRCSELMSNLPGHVRASYHGTVEHERVHSILADYDLFFLPTLGENYGHIILEALAAGTPVLIADTTPWRDLAKTGVGWELPLQDIAQFADKIDHAARLFGQEWKEMRKRALAFAESRQTDAVTVAANKNLFNEFSSA